MNSLDKISTEDYLSSLGPELPPKAMRKVILNTQEYKDIRQDIKQGIITDEMVKECIEKLYSRSFFKVGERFPYELTLATLAICYENYAIEDTEFAKEFITDLSSLRIAELSYATRIAKECLKHRRNNG